MILILLVEISIADYVLIMVLNKAKLAFMAATFGMVVS